MLVLNYQDSDDNLRLGAGGLRFGGFSVLEETVSAPFDTLYYTFVRSSSLLPFARLG